MKIGEYPQKLKIGAGKIRIQGSLGCYIRDAFLDESREGIAVSTGWKRGERRLAWHLGGEGLGVQNEGSLREKRKRRTCKV